MEWGCNGLFKIDAEYFHMARQGHSRKISQEDFVSNRDRRIVDIYSRKSCEGCQVNNIEVLGMENLVSKGKEKAFVDNEEGVPNGKYYPLC